MNIRALNLRHACGGMIIVEFEKEREAVVSPDMYGPGSRELETGRIRFVDFFCEECGARLHQSYVFGQKSREVIEQEIKSGLGAFGRFSG